MTDDEAAIRKVVETWMDASRAGDTASILDLMTDDVVFMVPGQEPFGKEEFAATAGMMADAKIDGKSEIVELCILGEWAFLRNHLEVSVAMPGSEKVRREGYTLTLMRKEKDGKWRVARDANLLALAK